MGGWSRLHVAALFDAQPADSDVRLWIWRDYQVEKLADVFSDEIVGQFSGCEGRGVVIGDQSEIRGVALL